MATIKIIANSNADAVWVWELLKKLEYEVEVVFDCSDDIRDNHRSKLLSKYEARQRLSEFSQEASKKSGFVTYDDSIGRQGNRYNSKKRPKIRR